MIVPSEQSKIVHIEIEPVLRRNETTIVEIESYLSILPQSTGNSRSITCLQHTLTT